MKPGPLKWHGGKAYLAKQIVELMPPRDKWLHYVEPYFGGGAVLLANDPEGISEVVNDKDRGLINFWNVLKEDHLFERFKRMAEATAFSEEEFAKAKIICEMASFVPSNDQGAIRLAVEFFTFCRQSLAGRMKGFTGITKTRVRRGMNNEVSAWLTAVEGLPAVHERLKRVLILNRDALDVIRSQDGPQTLFYCDPPYLHETRATTGEYEHEMTEQQHKDLLNLLAGIEGKFMLSGYGSYLYYDMQGLMDWNRHDFDLPNQAAGGSTKRRMTECVWTNY